MIDIPVSNELRKIFIYIYCAEIVKSKLVIDIYVIKTNSAKMTDKMLMLFIEIAQLESVATCKMSQNNMKYFR